MQRQLIRLFLPTILERPVTVHLDMLDRKPSQTAPVTFIRTRRLAMKCQAQATWSHQATWSTDNPATV